MTKIGTTGAIDALTGGKFHDKIMDAAMGKSSLKLLKDVAKNYSILGIAYKHRDKIADVAKKAYNNMGAWCVNSDAILRMKAFDESFGTACINGLKAEFGSDSVPKVAYESLFSK